MNDSLVPLLLVSPVLVAAAYSDLRHMRIPNGLSWAALAAFLLLAPAFVGAEQAAERAVVAAGVLAAGVAMFALRLVGGGDVKILAALFLFVPTSTMSVFLLTFSAAMLCGIALMPVLRAFPGAASSGWVALRRGAGFPMGISIALSGLAHPHVVMALQSGS